MARHLLPLICLLALGCTGKPSGPEPPTTTTPTAATATPAKPPAEANALLDAAGLELVPKGALFVVAARSVDALVEGFGYAALPDAVGAGWAEAKREVLAETGEDLLDPAVWKKLGLRTDQPIGLAVLDARNEAVMLFAGAGPELEASWRALVAKGGHQLTSEAVGDAVVLRDPNDKEAAAILRGGRVALVLADDSQGTWRQKIAGLSREASLAGHAPLKEDLQALGAGRDIGAWLNTPAVVDAVVAEATRDHQLEWQQRQLEQARAEGNAERAATLEAEIQRQKLADPLREAKARGQGVLLRGLLAGIGSLSVGLTFAGPDLRLSARLPLGKDSLPRAVFAPGKGPLALVETYGRRPTFLGTGRIDVAQTVQRAKALAVADKRNPVSEILQALQQVLEADPAELPKLVDGELGLAIHLGSPKHGGGMFAFLSGITGAGLIGLSDPPAAEERWKRLAGPRLAADGRLREDFAEGQISGGIAGRYLAGSTEAPFLDRLAKRDAGASFVKSLKSATLRALLERPDPAQLWVLEMGQLAVAAEREGAARMGAEVFRDALGFTALRVEIDEAAMRAEGGQFTGSKTVADAVAAVGGDGAPPPAAGRDWFSLNA